MNRERGEFAHPLFFEGNRVRRVYLGGKLLGQFLGVPEEDGHCPEEWIASTVRANGSVDVESSEGVSIVRGLGERFDNLLRRFPNELIGTENAYDLLVKVLDSARRLPVQVHPDKPFALAHFGLPHGKTESWIVLGCRDDASLYYGFRTRISRREFLEACHESKYNHDAVINLLNKVPVKPGDVYFVPAGMAHAIGAGCLVLEIQEPTDITIKPEAWFDGTSVDLLSRYAGLSESEAIDCFGYFDVVGKAAVDFGRKEPRDFLEENGIKGQHLISESDTSLFCVNRYRLSTAELRLGPGPSAWVVTNGTAVLHSGSDQWKLNRGNYFFLPHIATEVLVRAEGEAELVECLSPRAQSR